MDQAEIDGLLDVVMRPERPRTTVEQRVQAFEDRQAVRARIMEYGYLCDARRWDDLLAGVNVNEVTIANAPHPSRSPEREAVLNEWNHFGRHGRPDEFANAIAFLACDEASSLSGSTLNVDGGTLRFALL